jgi:rare lipoprotein A
LLVSLACCFLANCASSDKFSRQVDPKYGVASSARVIEEGQPVPKGGGTYRIGKPYQVAGRTYVPEHDPSYSAEGMASWYGSDFHGRLTANGEVYDQEAISAAHPTLPIPSYARVTNLSNGRSIVVRVNDRGPYAKDRVIDLSSKTAELLRYKGNGVARVRVEYVGPAPLEGSDDRKLVATLRQDQPAPAPSSVLVASNSSFIPQDARMVSGARGGYIPTPSERPFELGRYSTPMPSDDREFEPQAPMRTSRVVPPTQSARYITTPDALSLQSNALAFTSGRGLY